MSSNYNVAHLLGNREWLDIVFPQPVTSGGAQIRDQYPRRLGRGEAAMPHATSGRVQRPPGGLGRSAFAEQIRVGPRRGCPVLGRCTLVRQSGN